jgi:hypothetical protein
VTDSASDADGCEVRRVVEVPLNADHGVQPQQRDGRGRARQIDGTALQVALQLFRQSAAVDFQTELERRGWAQAGTDTAERLAHDCAMQPELTAPKILVAVGVVAERLAPARHHPCGVLPDARRIGIRLARGVVG